MPGISSTIKLTDAMSPALGAITGALHMTLDAFSAFQTAAAVNMDTTAFDVAKTAIQEADIALADYQEKVNAINRQATVLPTPQASSPSQWQELNTAQVFTNTGIGRFNAEAYAATTTMQQLLQTQQQISTQAASMDLLPSNALNDFNNIQEKVQSLQSAMLEIQNIPIYMRTDSLNNQIESIREQMQSVGVLQNQISDAMITMDTQAANVSLQQLDDRINSVTKHIRAINSQQIAPQWESITSPQVFMNTGIERFQEEMNAVNTAMENVLLANKRVQASAYNMRLLPPDARAEIDVIGNRMQGLAQKIQQINQIPVHMRTETLNNQLENLRGQFFQATNAAEALNTAMHGGDLSATNAAAQQLNMALDTMERNIRDNIRAQDNFNDSIAQGTKAASGLEGMIKRYGMAALSFTGAKKVLDLSDVLAQSTARINIMTGGLEDVGAVQDKIFHAAQQARGSYQEMLDMVGGLGIRAKDAFSSTDEIIKFSENVNKLYAIAGTGQSEAAGATIQLTQALGSGVLRGEELNSVFEAAPNLIQTVADYMEVPIGKIKELAADGELSADIVKNAVLSASADIDEQFSTMPMTFAQVATSIGNQALMAFQPVLTQIGEITASERFESMVTGTINGLVFLANVATDVFDVLATGAAFVYDNWDILEPIILGAAAAFGIYTGAVVANTVATGINTGLQKMATFQAKMHAAAEMMQSNATFAATAKQYGFNAALMACPITWIVGGIILAVTAFYALVAAINHVTGSSISATGLITGAFSFAFAVIGNLIMGATELILGTINYLINPFINFANFIGNLFTDPVSSVVYLFQGMADNVLGILETVASALDFILNTDMASAVAGWRDDLESWADDIVIERGFDPEDFNKIGTMGLSLKALGLQSIGYNDAWDNGYALGSSLFADDATGKKGNPAAREKDSTLALELLEIGNYNTAAIADSTHDITDSLDISVEEIKSMKDMAERDYINRFTTAEIKIDVGGINNTVNDAQDLDGIADYLIQKLVEDAQANAAGYHNY